MEVFFSAIVAVCFANISIIASSTQVCSSTALQQCTHTCISHILHIVCITPPFFLKRPMATETATFLSIRPTAQQTFSNTPNSTDKASIALFLLQKTRFEFIFYLKNIGCETPCRLAVYIFCYPPPHGQGILGVYHAITPLLRDVYSPSSSSSPSSFSSFLPLPSYPYPPPLQRERSFRVSDV